MFDEDDYDRGPSPMMFLSSMGVGMMPLMIVSTSAPILLYVIARWRDSRSPQPDPQLGLKFALCFFRIQGYQMMLMGLAFVVFSVLMKGEGRMASEMREMIYRPAFGLIVPAAIVFGVTSAMLPRTNQVEYPSVTRLFAGYNLMIIGSIGFFAFIALFVILFQEGESGQPGRIAWSAALVYATAAVVQAILFAKQVMEPPPPPSYAIGNPSGVPPADVPSPMQKPLA